MSFDNLISTYAEATAYVEHICFVCFLKIYRTVCISKNVKTKALSCFPNLFWERAFSFVLSLEIVCEGDS